MILMISLTGELPSVKDGTVNRSACVSTDKSCCELQMSIKVKMCSEFPVFLLPKTPGCSMAYCYGIYSFSGFENSIIP